MIAGFGLGTGAWPVAIEVAPLFPAGGPVLTLVGPDHPADRDSGSVMRLLLLPIPRVGLYIGQMAARSRIRGSCWSFQRSCGIPIGLAVGLKFLAAVIALVAGLAFLVFLTGLTPSFRRPSTCCSGIGAAATW